MAFTAFNSTEIEAGKPNKQELWTKTKDNFDSHEDRILTLEASIASFVPLTFEVFGPYTVNAAPQTGVMYERISFNMTALACRIMVQTAGPSGTLEVDIKYKRGAGAFTTIFSTKPSVSYSAGDLGLSTNGVLSVTDFLAGDIFRLDITSNQGSGAEGFIVYLEYER